jgi:hypothetical protein
MRFYFFLLFLIYFNSLLSQDSIYLKIHFLYGSKPLKAYKNEPKWFGGILGGHVGLESDSGKILNFLPVGKFHIFPKKKDKHGAYALYSSAQFYGYFGGNPDSVKKTTVFIPISKQQKMEFDSISKAYLESTPYDYALFGLRCGAASYKILGQLGILPKYTFGKTLRTITHPRKLRKRLLKKTTENGWKIVRKQGSDRRKWEKDK